MAEPFEGPALRQRTRSDILLELAMAVSKDPGDTESTRAPFAPKSAAIALLCQMTKFLLST